MAVPSSKIFICSGVRLNSRYEHSIYFADPAAQEAYFQAKVDFHTDGYTFLRKSWPIKIKATMERAKSWSYLFFRNAVDSKTYYYFVNNIEYINDNTVQLTLELDVLQTYMFDYELLPSFVERQHVDDDTPGLHTQEEGLDPGEYRCEAPVFSEGLEELCIMVLSSITLNGTSAETTVNAYGGMYNNVFSGLMLSAVPNDKWDEWSRQLDNLSEWGKIDGIIAMWMYPKALVSLGGESTWNDGDIAKVVAGAKAITFSHPIVQSGKINGHTVKNNKLYCYPFNFLYVTNNNGGSAVYRFERFTNDSGSAEFTVKGALAPDTGARMYPFAYNGPESYYEGLSLGSFPSCAWDADGYKIWIAQNQNQHDLNARQGTMMAAVGGITAVASLVTGNVAGAVGGVMAGYAGYNQVQGLLAAQNDKAIEPPQSRGTFSANLTVSSNRHLFTAMRKTVSREYAARIDDFFTMYGYKINRVQKPNRHARQGFTYIKTNGCHIAANLCNEDTVKIESIYDHGITWWVDGDSIGNYGQDNVPLGGD